MSCAHGCGSAPMAHFRSDPEIIGAGKQFVLPALAIDIPFEEIYRGVG